jgi:hypothetical protein
MGSIESFFCASPVPATNKISSVIFVISLAQHGISWQQSRLLLIHFEGYFHLVFEYIRVLLGTAKIALIVVLRTCLADTYYFPVIPFFRNFEISRYTFCLGF